MQLQYDYVGDLNDDSCPEFMQIFHRYLSILCDDMFFSRYKSNEKQINKQVCIYKVLLKQKLSHSILII